jgi:hypothetical protein
MPLIERTLAGGAEPTVRPVRCCWRRKRREEEQRNGHRPKHLGVVEEHSNGLRHDRDACAILCWGEYSVTSVTGAPGGR